MKYTAETARRIALAGVTKMYQQGYAFERAEPNSDPDRFFVIKPSGIKYRVTVFDAGRGERGYCSCPFSDNGWENVTCKHVEFVRDQIAAEDALCVREEVSAALHRVWADHPSVPFGCSSIAHQYASDADAIEAAILPAPTGVGGKPAPFQGCSSCPLRGLHSGSIGGVT
jgi:hypothetical protein